MPKKWLLIKIASMLLTLSACGWQLRDAPLLSDSLGTIYVSYHESQATIATEIERALKANNVKLVSSSENPNYQLKIIDTNQSRRITTLNSSARATQYKIFQTVDFIVLDTMGKPIIPVTTVSAESTYNFDDSDLLASQNEEIFLKNNLRSKVIRQILRRLGEVSNGPIGQ